MRTSKTLESRKRIARTIAAPAPRRFSRMTSNRKVSIFSVQTRKVSRIWTYSAKPPVRGQAVPRKREKRVSLWLTELLTKYAALRRAVAFARLGDAGRLAGKNKKAPSESERPSY